MSSTGWEQLELQKRIASLQAARTRTGWRKKPSSSSKRKCIRFKTLCDVHLCVLLCNSDYVIVRVLQFVVPLGNVWFKKHDEVS